MSKIHAAGQWACCVYVHT